MPEIVEPDGTGERGTFEKQLGVIIGEGRRVHDVAGVGREDELALSQNAVRWYRSKLTRLIQEVRNLLAETT